MTVHYVDDTAAGTNAGTSWTNAWTSLASATGVSAGDEVRVASTHSEDTGAAWTLDFASATEKNPVVVVSCNTGTDAYTSGATFGATGGVYVGQLLGPGVVHYGMTYNGYDIRCGESGRFVDCVLNVQRYLLVTYSNDAQTMLHNCNCTIALTNGQIQSSNYSLAQWHGGEVQFNANMTGANLSTGHNSYITFDGVDFAAGSGSFTQSIATINNSFGSGGVIYRNCRLPTNWTAPTFSDDANQHFCLVERSDSGTVSAPVLGLIGSYHANGVSACDSGRYRSGGATDGETNYSLAMTPDGTDVPTQFYPLIGVPITRWVDAGSQTLTIYFASGTTHTDKTLWFDVVGPSEAATATPHGKWQSDIGSASSADSATNHTTDSSSTWNGTGVGTKQQQSFTINPTEPGVLSVIPYLAGANAVYIDPQLSVA